MLEDILFSDGLYRKCMLKKNCRFFFVVKMVKKEIGLDISMQIAKCLKLYTLHI